MFIQSIVSGYMKKLFFIILCFILSTITVAQNTILLRPNAADGKDAHITKVYPDVNYGDDYDFEAIATNQSIGQVINRSFIKFDLSAIPSGATIVFAKLNLSYHTDKPHYVGGGNETILQRITSEWDEFGVTWNNQPTITEQNQVEIPALDPNSITNYSAEVTAMVQDMIDDPENSHGFMFRLVDETPERSTHFCSSDHENADLHPRLYVEYEMSECVLAVFDFNGNANDQSGKNMVESSLEANTQFVDGGTGAYAAIFDGVVSFFDVKIPESEYLGVFIRFKANQQLNDYAMLFSTGNDEFYAQLLGPLYNSHNEMGQVFYRTKLYSDIYSELRMDDNQWHTIFMDFNNNTKEQRMYVDGVHISTIVSEADLNISKLQFGAKTSMNTTDYYFSGYIDNITIYSCPPEESEIKELSSTFSEQNQCLVAHYSLDNGATNDISGNNNHATNQNIEPGTNRLAKLNKAILLGGSGSMFETDLDNLTTIGVSFWFNASHQPNDFARFFSTNHTYFYCELLGPYYQIYDAVGEIFFRTDFSDDINTEKPKDDDNWHHVYVDFDGESKTQRMFVDGILVNSLQTDNSISINKIRFGGAMAGDEKHWYNGALDDIKIFNCILSDNEIQQIANDNFDFTIPDTTCVNQPFEIENHTTAENYEWTIRNVNDKDFGGIADIVKLPHWQHQSPESFYCMETVQTNHDFSNLFTIEKRNSGWYLNQFHILENGTDVDFAYQKLISNYMVDESTIAMDIAKYNNKYYIFVSTTGQNYVDAPVNQFRVFSFDENTPLTEEYIIMSNDVYISNIKDIEVEYQNNKWNIFLSYQENFIRQYVAEINSSEIIEVKEIYTGDYATLGMQMVKINEGNYHLFAVSDTKGEEIKRLDFGSSLTNTPELNTVLLLTEQSRISNKYDLSIVEGAKSYSYYFASDVAYWTANTSSITSPQLFIEQGNTYDFFTHSSLTSEWSDLYGNRVLYMYAQNTDNTGQSIYMLMLNEQNSSTIFSTLQHPEPLTISQPGTYEICLTIPKVTDENGDDTETFCQTIEITDTGKCFEPLFTIPETVCAGELFEIQTNNSQQEFYDFIHIDPNGEVEYLWPLLNSIKLYEAGSHQICALKPIPTGENGMDENHCETIEVLPPPKPNLGDDIEIPYGETVTLDAGEFAQYTWNTGSNNRYLDVSESGNYAVTVENKNGCSSNDEIKVNIIPTFKIRPTIIGHYVVNLSNINMEVSIPVEIYGVERTEGEIYASMIDEDGTSVLLGSHDVYSRGCSGSMQNDNANIRLNFPDNLTSQFYTFEITADFKHIPETKKHRIDYYETEINSSEYIRIQRGGSLNFSSTEKMINLSTKKLIYTLMPHEKQWTLEDNNNQIIDHRSEIFEYSYKFNQSGLFYLSEISDFWIDDTPDLFSCIISLGYYIQAQSQTITIEVFDPTANITAVETSPFMVTENQPTEATVFFDLDGVFSSDNVFTVYLSDQNGDFANETTLQTTLVSASVLSVTIPAGTPSSKNYRLRIKSSETQKAGTASRPFEIRFNHAPSGILLSDNTINENTAAGTQICTLSVTDTDIDTWGDSHSFEVLSENTFSVDNNTLKSSIVPDFETQNIYTVEIQTSDVYGRTYSAIYSILVININEPPEIETPQQIYAKEYTLSAISGISISDEDAFDGLLSISLIVNNGNLLIQNTQNIVFDTQNNLPHIQFTGKLDDINQAISTLQYKSTRFFYGTEILTINVSDMGNSGLSDADELTASVFTNIEVQPLPPEIEEQPEPLIKACTGDVYHIKTKAVAADKISYQWYRDDAILFSEKSNKLTIRVKDAKQNGKYRCEISGLGGTVWTNACMLYVKPQDISAEAENVTICYGYPNGNIKVTASGGWDYKYEYSKNGGNNWQSSNLFPELSVGTYSIAVRDSNNCVAKTKIEVKAPPRLTPMVQKTNIPCNGFDSGKINFRLWGGTTPYNVLVNSSNQQIEEQYEFDNNRAQIDYNMLKPGLYSFDITDANQCDTFAIVQISEPEKLRFHIKNIESPTCFGGDNGKLDFTLSGGTSPIRFYWTNEHISRVIADVPVGLHQLHHLAENKNGLPAGEYEFVIIDKNKCDTSAITQIEQPEQLHARLLSKTNETENSKGSAVVAVEGGTMPYNLSNRIQVINNFTPTENQQGVSFENMYTGHHSIQIWDANHCYTTIDVDIQPYSPPLPYAGFNFASKESTVYFYANCQHTTHYFWDFGDGEYSNQKNPVHHYSSTGSYTATLTATNKSGKSIASNIVEVITQSITSNNEQTLSVYPNPTSGIFNITIPNQTEIQLQIFDMFGRMVFYHHNITSSKFDMRNLAKGMYLIKCKSGNKEYSKKLIIE